MQSLPVYMNLSVTVLKLGVLARPRAHSKDSGSLYFLELAIENRPDLLKGRYARRFFIFSNDRGGKERISENMIHQSGHVRTTAMNFP